MTPTEAEWRPVSWAPGYEVSDDGRVRSWRPRNRYCEAPVEPRPMSPTSDSYGYHRVALRVDGRRVPCLVHRLVARAFVPNPEGKPLVCHRNGSPGDNRAANLRWDDQVGNMADTARHGTRRQGTSSNLARLTEDEVRGIRAAEGTQSDIARRYGVTQPTVSAIRSGATWKHLSA